MKNSFMDSIGQSPLNLAVFGAAGKFWRNVEPQVAPKFRRVIPVDPQLPHGRDPVESAQEADVILISVKPDEEIIRISQTIRDHIRGKFVIDNHTVKHFNALQEMHDAGAFVCSMHTMVRTDSPHTDHPLQLMPFDHHCAPAAEIVRIIGQALRMRIEEVPLRNHNERMALLQGPNHLLPHVKAMALRMAAAEAGIAEDDLRRIAPASALLTTLGENRTMLDPKVSASIVHNALQTSDGQLFLISLRIALEKIERAADSPTSLEKLFRKNNKRNPGMATEEQRHNIKRTADEVIAHIQKSTS